jgi:hypothetical protein
MLLSNDQGSAPSTVKHPRATRAPDWSRSLFPSSSSKAREHRESGVAFFLGFFANGRLDGRPFASSIAEFHERPSGMTRAGLEPATYGLKERILIVVLASFVIAESCRPLVTSANN